MPQPQPRQQLWLNDMQMLQRHIMLKQLQELRRHQQLQELGDGRQQNYLNQPSANNKQASGCQFLPLVNGTPIHDASQMLTVDNISLVQRGASPAVQGFPNGLFSQAQSQDMHLMGVVPQQLEESLYGTPIASSRNNLTQYSHLQGLSHDSSNLLSKSSDNQTEKPTMQSSDSGNSFLGENFNVSSDQLSMSHGAFLSKQLVHGKNLFGQVPIQGFSSGILPENFQQVNTQQRNASAQEFNERQEQTGWPEQFPGNTTQSDSSQGLTTLDPLEQKILFNMDDNPWNASLGRNTDMGTGGFGNTLECADYLGSFPSIQSGSWSALMQSAVAEASSCDTGLQEEWSGLSFQNAELSTNNQPSNFVESAKQQTGWVDNNVQSASSLSCKPQLLFNDSNMSSGFPGFQQSGIQFSIKHREAMHSDSSHESVQQSPKIAANWLDCKYQLNQPIQGSQPIHTIQPLEKAWPGQSFEHSLGGLEQVKSGADSTMVEREDSQSNNFATLPNSLTTKVDQETCQRVPGSSSHGQGYFAQFKFVGDVPNSAVDLEKGCLHDIQRNSEASEEVAPSGNIGAIASASFDRSVGIHGPSLTSQTRQNMLELLHKVDHAREQRTVTHLSSTDSSSLLDMPEAETPEASMAKSYDQSTVSQRFGLRLAPPSQQLPNSNNFFSLQSSPQSGNSIAMSPTGPLSLRNQLQRPHLPAAPVETQSPQATLPGMASRLPHFNRATSQGTSQPISINPFGQQFPILEAAPVSQPSLTSGLSQQVGSSTRPLSVWTKVPTHPRLSGMEPCELPSDLLLSADSTSINLQTPSWATRELHDQNCYRRTVSQEVGACSMNSQGFDHGQESVAKHPSEANAISSGSFMGHPNQQNFDSAQHGEKQSLAVSAGDLEAFGRSLKPYNLHPNYSLLHQVRSLNNLETDPSRSVLEKNHGAGSDLNVQQVTDVADHQSMYGHNPGARGPVNNGQNMASQLNSFPTRDVKMLSFSSEVGDDHSDSVKASPLPLVQDTAQEMAIHGQSYSQSDSNCNSVAFNRTEHSQISLQMAPSWFNHYGTLKNGQMLPMYDARTAKNPAQQFPLRKPFENLHMNTSMVQVNVTGASQVSSVWPITATTLAAGKVSYPCALPPDVTEHNLSVVRSKKRKIETSELLPWYKEVTQSSKRLQTIRTAELEWAQAANRLVEKVEHEAEMIEDVQPLLQPKKRLVLTTQLMQQVFRPAPAAILSADATSNYDSMAYFAAKLALGDACNLTSCSRSDSCISSKGCEMMPEKPKTSERIGEQYFSKIVEDFTSQVKKLESYLFRLDKTASIADIRVEYQELEKFSVINRFAKFHSRGQPHAAETSSSSGTTPTVPKSFPQRYVTAFPMPRAVPQGAQCLSL